MSFGISKATESGLAMVAYPNKNVEHRDENFEKAAVEKHRSKPSFCLIRQTLGHETHRNDVDCRELLAERMQLVLL